MRLPSDPTPAARPPASSRRDDDPGSRGRQLRRTFLTVNAVPLGIGVALSCSTALTAVQVYGRLTLGVVWGALQLGVFLGSVWWYEHRAARPRDPGGRSPSPQPPYGVRESGW
ncbi:hypothetical protein [Streptomyces sp. NPDC126499]|uniref:hypothetical protein n=1 Tax=Streptomyces sp. NPDC126499 TaxID=3155314 RepID=UPI00332ACE28